MNDLPSPPKGYLIAKRGAAVGYQSRPILFLSKSRKWVEYPLTKLRPCDWNYSFWHDPPGGPYYALPKPRYTCPLEFSRYVPDALESLL